MESVQILVNTENGKDLLKIAGNNEKKSLYVTTTNLQDTLEEILSWQQRTHSLFEEILEELKQMNASLNLPK